MKRQLIVATVLGVVSTAAGATPFTVFDARSAGMGSVGVASSPIGAAPFFNPAMLAAQRPDDDFAFHAGVGVLGQDPNGLLDDIKDFNDAVDASDAAAATAAVNAASGKSLFVQGNAAVALGFAGTTWSGALSANRYAQADTYVLGASPIENSTLNFNGVQVTEIGLSLARDIGRFSVGVTPKVMGVKTYFGQPRLADNQNLTDILDSVTNEGEKDHGNSVNLDLGLVYRLSEHWQLGLVHRNAKSEEYLASDGVTRIKIEPQTRAGIAYNGDVFTVGMDYDVVKNDPLTPRGQQSQMLALGGEANVFKTLKLRIGYAKNMADSSDLDLYSAGLGVNVFGVHVDVAAVGNDSTLSAYAQAGVQF